VQADVYYALLVVQATKEEKERMLSQEIFWQKYLDNEPLYFTLIRSLGKLIP